LSPDDYHEARDLAIASGVARGVDYTGGRRLHRWAREAGFDVLRIDAYHPYSLTGEHSGSGAGRSEAGPTSARRAR
jgi:hypothetical protein